MRWEVTPHVSGSRTPRRGTPARGERMGGPLLPVLGDGARDQGGDVSGGRRLLKGWPPPRARMGATGARDRADGGGNRSPLPEATHPTNARTPPPCSRTPPPMFPDPTDQRPEPSDQFPKPPTGFRSRRSIAT
jgi:hypothetical protein